MNFRQQLLTNLGRNTDFEEHSPEPILAGDCPVKLIAFYLPQYHPTSENDIWWGKGFTEWTNVTKAIPRFVGHYQPHLPGELGFYDLRLPDTLRRQAELARHYGIGGFCFHHYWFNGRRILQGPLDCLLEHPDIDIPFCINWANESWTRTWDGQEKDVLLSQTHSDADDIAFARALEPLIRDHRYIKINSRPLIMVYRPALLPDASATVARWRDHFARADLGDPFFVMAQCFGDHDPHRYGFDAAAEFPPHKVGWSGKNLVSATRTFGRDYDGRVLSYDQMARTAMHAANEPFTLFRGVCPMWDNEARKPNRGVSFVNSTPAKYGEWLRWACRDAMGTNRFGERIVFINAWNEWAEGAHLEPDRHYGYGYLNQTAAALRDAASGRIHPTDASVFEDNELRPAQTNLLARLKASIRSLIR